jgi:hypothetical protein
MENLNLRNGSMDFSTVVEKSIVMLLCLSGYTGWSEELDNLKKSVV